MTSNFFPSPSSLTTAPSSTEKTQPTLALAFAVASLQNPGLEGFYPIPQSLLDAATVAASQAATTHAGSFYNKDKECQLLQPPYSLSPSQLYNFNQEHGRHQTQQKQEETTLPFASQLSNKNGAVVSTNKSKEAQEEMKVGQPHREQGGDHRDAENYSSANDVTTSVDNDNDDDDGDGDDDDENLERRLARSRERNREHARKTRLRKKAQLNALQDKVKRLELERQELKQKVEECGIASILVGLSSSAADGSTHAEAQPNGAEKDTTAPSVLLDKAKRNTDKDGTPEERHSDIVAVLSGSKRKRFISEAISDDQSTQEILQQQQQQHRLTINVDGKETEIGAGKSHINWKTGVYRDNDGVQKQLTSQQLEDLRRERNRIHAKMTRSRKKCFIATIEKTIAELESENNRMRSVLSRMVPGSESTSQEENSHPAGAGASVVENDRTLASSSPPIPPNQTLISPATSPALAPALACTIPSESNVPAPMPLSLSSASLSSSLSTNMEKATATTSTPSCLPSCSSSSSNGIFNGFGGSHRKLKSFKYFQRRSRGPTSHGFTLKD